MNELNHHHQVIETLVLPLVEKPINDAVWDKCEISDAVMQAGGMYQRGHNLISPLNWVVLGKIEDLRPVIER